MPLGCAAWRPPFARFLEIPSRCALLEAQPVRWQVQIRSKVALCSLSHNAYLNVYSGTSELCNSGTIVPRIGVHDGDDDLANSLSYDGFCTRWRPPVERTGFKRHKKNGFRQIALEPRHCANFGMRRSWWLRESPSNNYTRSDEHTAHWRIGETIRKRLPSLGQCFPHVRFSLRCSPTTSSERVHASQHSKDSRLEKSSRDAGPDPLRSHCRNRRRAPTP